MHQGGPCAAEALPEGAEGRAGGVEGGAAAGLIRSDQIVWMANSTRTERQ